ncbi:MAG: hypothetical protein ACJ75B_08445 [Flavisolibacter sp.]
MQKFIYILFLGALLATGCNNSSQQTYQAPSKDTTMAKDTTKKDSADISNPNAMSEPH